MQIDSERLKRAIRREMAKNRQLIIPDLTFNPGLEAALAIIKKMEKGNG